MNAAAMLSRSAQTAISLVYDGHLRPSSLDGLVYVQGEAGAKIVQARQRGVEIHQQQNEGGAQGITLVGMAGQSANSDRREGRSEQERTNSGGLAGRGAPADLAMLAQAAGTTSEIAGSLKRQGFNDQQIREASNDVRALGIDAKNAGAMESFSLIRKYDVDADATNKALRAAADAMRRDKELAEWIRQSAQETDPQKKRELEAKIQQRMEEHEARNGVPQRKDANKDRPKAQQGIDGARQQTRAQVRQDVVEGKNEAAQSRTEAQQGQTNTQQHGAEVQQHGAEGQQANATNLASAAKGSAIDAFNNAAPTPRPEPPASGGTAVPTPPGP